MRIADVMTANPRTVAPGDSLQRAAALMDDLNVGMLPVCDRDRLVGVITDRDITVRATAAGRAPDECCVADAMSEDVCWTHEDDDVRDAERLMCDMQVRRVPVMNDRNRLTGVVSLGDLATKGARGVRGVLEDVSWPSRPDR